MRVTDERLAQIRARLEAGVHLLNVTHSDEAFWVIVDLQDSRAEIARLKGQRTCKCGRTLTTPNEQFVNQCIECEKKEIRQRKYSAFGYYPREGES